MKQEDNKWDCMTAYVFEFPYWKKIEYSEIKKGQTILLLDVLGEPIGVMKALCDSYLQENGLYAMNGKLLRLEDAE